MPECILVTDQRRGMQTLRVMLFTNLFWFRERRSVLGLLSK